MIEVIEPFVFQVLNINEARLPVAKVIPILCSLTNNNNDNSDNSRPDPLLAAFSRLDSIGRFTANVYEAFSTATEERGLASCLNEEELGYVEYAKKFMQSVLLSD